MNSRVEFSIPNQLVRTVLRERGPFSPYSGVATPSLWLRQTIFPQVKKRKGNPLRNFALEHVATSGVRVKRVFEAVKETREECCSVFHPRPWALRGRDEYMAA